MDLAMLREWDDKPGHEPREARGRREVWLGAASLLTIALLVWGAIAFASA